MSKRVLVIFCLLFVLIGCARSPEKNTYADRLNIDWSGGTTWNTDVTLWPARITSPRLPGDTTVRRTWSHRVQPSTDGSRRIVVNRGDTRYLLSVTERNDVASVKILREINEEGVIQTRSLGQQSGWGRGGPFYPNVDRSELSNLWFVPALSGTALNEWKRYTILSSQRSTGRWLEQKVVPVENGLRFVLRNQDGSEKITVLWHKGEPWWNRAVWYRHRRVVGLSELVKSTESR